VAKNLKLLKKDSWIVDNWDATKGRSITVKIKKHLVSYKSKFQKLDIYDTYSFGRMLTLDGVIMCTEFDEFSYHEMITHAAMHVHPYPRKVLVIGGGDGGTIREVLKYNVDEAHLCEIDEEVVNVSKKYLPKLASGFKDPRVKLFFEDGAQFVKKNKGVYDVIIVDSSDPIGPAEILFQEEFYKDMHDALTKDGIVVTQSECIFYDRSLIKKLFDFNSKIYKYAKYFYTMIPTYPSGSIGFSFCSKKYDPVKHVRDKKIKDLKYYNIDIHKAAFVLPTFIKKEVFGK
jgi:spermidine synthase